MKYKSYDDSLKSENIGNESVELVVSNDAISDRAINRPIENLRTNIEESYAILQQLIKTVYGNKIGIVPNVYENFDPARIQVGRFHNNGKYYIRVPFGLAFLRTPDWDYTRTNINGYPVLNNQVGLDNGNLFNFKTNTTNSYYLEQDNEAGTYTETINTEQFQKDFFHSYSIYNQPNTELYERELASLVYMDLNDMENDIKVSFKLADTQTGKKTIYQMKVDRATFYDPERTYLPEILPNTIFKITLRTGNSTANNGELDFQLKDENNNILKTFQIFYGPYDNQDSIASRIAHTIEVQGYNWFNVDFEDNWVTLEFKEDDTLYDRYSLSTTLDFPGVDASTSTQIAKTNTQTFVGYDNVFDITNSFITKYSQSMISTEHLGDKLSLETLIPIDTDLSNIIFDGSGSNPGSNQKRYIYYNKDLVDHHGSEPYRILDKTKRFGLSLDDNPLNLPKDVIPMFAIILRANANGEVSLFNAISLLDTYDMRTIYSKRAALNSIRIDTRTELVNWLHFKEKEVNPKRELEILGDTQYVTITSPLLKLQD
jgi:hypothetical protein